MSLTRPADDIILASRSPDDGELLVIDGAVPVECAWDGLWSRDKHEIRVRWTPRVAVVDARADRELLAERFLGSTRTLHANAVAEHLVTAAASDLKQRLGEFDVDDLLGGAHDVALNETLQAAAKRAAFAAGLAVLPPFVLTIDSPSVERDRKLAALRDHMAAVAEVDTQRISAITSLAKTLATLPAGAKCSDALTGVRLSDPRDLLRAIAIADPTWSEPLPSLWLGAGERVVEVEPTRPSIDLSRAIIVSGIGPIRSVRGATHDGRRLLLVGARAGVAVIDANARQVLRIFQTDPSGDVGFNAVAIAGDVIAATHSQLGLASRSLDGEGKFTIVALPDGIAANGRGLVATGDAFALLIDGRVATFDSVNGLKLDAAAPTRCVELLTTSDDKLIATTSDGAMFVADRTRNWLRVPSSVASSTAAVFEICGSLRLAVVGSTGTHLTLVDAAGSPAITLADMGGARALRTRPGYIAAIPADRTRVQLVAAGRPDERPIDLPIAAVLGNRVADACFA